MGSFHPQIVHFVIGLLIVGVAFRAVSLLGRPAFLSPAATTLLLLGTIAAAAAVYSGEAAHDPVEAMPGLRPMVTEHEEWGERTRNVFFVVAVIELLGLALARSSKLRMVQVASTVVGLVGVFCLFEAGDHGGKIVYDYAGGVALRPSAPEGVQRLLLAGLYHQARVSRRDGNAGDAAQLIDQAAQRFSNDVEVQLLRAESLLVDRKDPNSALQALRAITPPADQPFVRVRHGMLTADALLAAGQRDGAIATLQQLNAAVPNRRVQQRLQQLQQGK